MTLGEAMVKKNGSIEFKVKLRSFSPLGNVVKFCQGRQMVCIWGSQMFSDCTGLLSLSMQHLPASEMQLVFRSIRVDLKIQLLVFLLLGRIDNSLLFHKSMYNMRWHILAYIYTGSILASISFPPTVFHDENPS